MCTEHRCTFWYKYSWNWLKTSQIYAVYSPNRCYPEYVIHYKMIEQNYDEDQSSYKDKRRVKKSDYDESMISSEDSNEE